MGRDFDPPAAVDVSCGTGDGTGRNLEIAREEYEPILHPAVLVFGSLRRIDMVHTAPKPEWIAMGMPQWPTPEENKRIFAASVLQKAKFPIIQQGEQLTFSVSVPANSVVAVQVPIGGDTDVIGSELKRDQRASLAAAQARLAAAAAEVAAIKASLHSPR